MDKNHIVRFLKEKKRGIYTVIVQMYPEVITSAGVTMALEIIREDLEKETGKKVDLNYFSLAQAISKFKSTHSKSKDQSGKKWEFKDSHELKPDQTPGKFKLD